MQDKIINQRVVTFLNRQEVEFLDKLEKDMAFSTGRHLSRSKIIEDLVDLLTRTQMDGEGIKNDQELEKRVMQAIARLFQKEQNQTGGGVK